MGPGRFPIKNPSLAQYWPILAFHWRLSLNIGQYWLFIGICRSNISYIGTRWESVAQLGIHWQPLGFNAIVNLVFIGLCTIGHHWEFVILGKFVFAWDLSSILAFIEIYWETLKDCIHLDSVSIAKY